MRRGDITFPSRMPTILVVLMPTSIPIAMFMVVEWCVCELWMMKRKRYKTVSLHYLIPYAILVSGVVPVGTEQLETPYLRGAAHVAANTRTNIEVAYPH